MSADSPPIKHVGHYSDEDAYNADTEKTDRRKIKIACPGCGNLGAPLCSSKTKKVGLSRHGFDDCIDRHALYETQCRCGKKYRFTVVSG